MELANMAGECARVSCGGDCTCHVTSPDLGAADLVFVGSLVLTNFRLLFTPSVVVTPTAALLDRTQYWRESPLRSTTTLKSRSPSTVTTTTTTTTTTGGPPFPSASLAIEFPLAILSKVSRAAASQQGRGGVGAGRQSRASAVAVEGAEWGAPSPSLVISGAESEDRCVEVAVSPYYPSAYYGPLRFYFSSAADCVAVHEALSAFVTSLDVGHFFSFVHRPAPPGEHFVSMAASLSDETAEFLRQGLDLRSPACKWRLTEANAQYKLSPTYPRVLVVPKIVNDSELAQVATFRSKARIPVLSWYHPSGATITRGSQPLVGVFNSRSEEDIRLIDAIRLANNQSKLMYILDSRPHSNGMVNKALGGGYENAAYSNTTLEFLSLPNIHTVRDSFLRLRESCQNARSLTSPASSYAWLSQQAASGWFDNLRVILAGVSRLVGLVECENASVFIHCSDSWDRTAQLCSLAMLCLDPFYRTIRGFAALIEQEWLKMGHRFRDRLHADALATATSSSGPVSIYEASPVFMQFLDCVWQLTRQFPRAFEFNESLLVTVLEESLVGRFGTFLCNSDKERTESKLSEKTPSLWPFLFAASARFLNPHYDPAASTRPVRGASQSRRQQPKFTSPAPVPQSTMRTPSPRQPMVVTSVSPCKDVRMSLMFGTRRASSDGRLGMPFGQSVLFPRIEPHLIQFWTGMYRRYLDPPGPKSQAAVASAWSETVSSLSLRNRVGDLESENRTLKEHLAQLRRELGSQHKGSGGTPVLEDSTTSSQFTLAGQDSEQVDEDQGEESSAALCERSAAVGGQCSLQTVVVAGYQAVAIDDYYAVPSPDRPSYTTAIGTNDVNAGPIVPQAILGGSSSGKRLSVPARSHSAGEPSETDSVLSGWVPVPR